MTQMMSGSKADPAYEDEERTSDTATLKVVPLNPLQCVNTRLLQLPRTRNMGRYDSAPEEEEEEEEEEEHLCGFTAD
ncbi:MAG: hypothetical protein ALECFALPRED_001809 [Alectoria fallacina]|uniref:Uncharacterized protein n=1 Tax=Alectoria fallacina TaxID=1903189 RepID=A0A8H3IPR0_9LECA|nr:MAG: hypothetical protein ALECFALPRED_001809 [Alectoria fallacina]